MLLLAPAEFMEESGWPPQTPPKLLPFVAKNGKGLITYMVPAASFKEGE